jgi:hypothetical protein
MADIHYKANKRPLRTTNGKLHDELLNGAIFYSLREAQVVINLGGRSLMEAPPWDRLYAASEVSTAATPLFHRKTG